MGFGYMFVCWIGADINVELMVWCDLCEKLSVGYKTLMNSFISFMG